MNNLIRLRDGEPHLVPDDPWTLVREVGEGLPDGPLILPLALWREREGRDGLLLQPDDEVETLGPLLGAEVPLVAVDFPSFRDGRGYSQAYCCAAGSAGTASCARWAMCCATSSRTCASAASMPSPCARTSPSSMRSRGWPGSACSMGVR